MADSDASNAREKSIHLYVGYSYEPFSPETYRLKGGGGGAETATIELCNHWGAMGWKVTIWGRAVGEYGNVSCRNYMEWNPSLKCDIFIAWRNTSALTHARPNARRVVLMSHDIWLGGQIDNAVAARIDDVACVSRYHAGYLSACHHNLANKVVVFGNAINPQHWDHPRPKVPHRYVFSNNPSQGLVVLLDQWHKVRQAIPNAELHVAYGFDLPLLIARGMNRPEQEAQLLHLKKRCETEPGIVLHSRLNIQDLVALETSSVGWLQPPDDTLHTFCITALEMQIASVVPISRTNGALPETLKNFIAWRHPDELTDLLVHAVPRFSPTQLAENVLWASAFTWRAQAERWIKYLTDNPAEAA